MAINANPNARSDCRYQDGTNLVPSHDHMRYRIFPRQESAKSWTRCPCHLPANLKDVCSSSGVDGGPQPPQPFPLRLVSQLLQAGELRLQIR